VTLAVGHDIDGSTQAHEFAGRQVLPLSIVTNLILPFLLAIALDVIRAIVAIVLDRF
jgi:hypothetical protein